MHPGRRCHRRRYRDTQATTADLLIARSAVQLSHPADVDDSAWTINDAWILAAIAMGRSQAAQRLTDLIATADAINHSLPTEAEFTDAIRHLLSAGLIGADPTEDRYWPTERGVQIRKRWTRGMFEWANAILPQLEQLDQPQASEWAMPAGKFDQAYRDYQARWRR